MKRAKKDPETTKLVWWEDLPQDLEDFLKKRFEEAEERDEKRQEKRVQKRAEKKIEMTTISEDSDNADWLKRPSDLIASLNNPKIKTNADLVEYLERNGLTETLLYRRLKSEPNFQ